MFAVYGMDTLNTLWHVSPSGNWHRAYPSQYRRSAELSALRFDTAAKAVAFVAQHAIAAPADFVDAYVSDGSEETVELLAL